MKSHIWIPSPDPGFHCPRFLYEWLCFVDNCAILEQQQQFDNSAMDKSSWLHVHDQSAAMHMQERGRWIFIVQFSLSFALLWWVKTQSCASIAFTWLGLLPAQVSLLSACPDVFN